LGGLAVRSAEAAGACISILKQAKAEYAKLQ
jgi:hypothetical protein